MSDSFWPHALRYVRAPCPWANSQSLLKLPIELVMPSNYLILYRPLLFLSSSIPSIGVFSNESVFLHQVSASASVLPMNIQSWFPLGWTGWISLHSKGLSRVSQHHSSKSSILGHSAFFIVQLLHPYMTAGKIKALTRHLLAKQCLCFLMCLSRLIAFLQISISLCLTSYSHRDCTITVNLLLYLECIIALFISCYSS